MQVNTIQNNNFGQIILSKTAMQKIGYTLHKKSVNGEREFLHSFYENWEKCRKTVLNDLVITDDGKVFVQSKKHGSQKEINNFPLIMDNILNGMKDVVFREKIRMHS